MVCRRFRCNRDDERNDELTSYAVLSNRVTARRCKPARAAICLSIVGHDQEGQCPPLSRHLARSGGFSLTILNLWRCHCWRVVLGDVPFLPAVGDTPCTSVASRTLGKMRPGFWPNSGSRFPDGVGCGNRDPEYCFETGCRFPNGAQLESASQFEASKRDAVSARHNRRDCVARRFRYSPKISVASSSWVSTT